MLPMTESSFVFNGVPLDGQRSWPSNIDFLSLVPCSTDFCIVLHTVHDSTTTDRSLAEAIMLSVIINNNINLCPVVIIVITQKQESRINKIIIFNLVFFFLN